MSDHRVRLLGAATIALGGMVLCAASAQAAPLSYQNAVLSDNPYLYYRLGETTDPLTNVAADDISANNVDGVYRGTPTGGIPGQGAASDTAVSFPGSGSNYLRTGTIDGTKTDRGFGSKLGNSSFELLFKVNAGFDTTTYQSAFGVYNSADATAAEITLNSKGNDAYDSDPNTAGKQGYANNTRLFLRSADTQGVGVSFVNASVYDGNYHDVVFTYDSSQPGVAAFAAYVDGIAQPLDFFQVNGTTNPTMFTDFAYDPTFALRNVRGSVSQPANITLDEAALYASTLSGAQAIAHAAAADISIPEPASLGLFAVAGLGLLRRRRRHA